jgi:hypothetical protein
MSNGKFVPPRGVAPVGPQSESRTRSGRPTFDSRGNAVWEWQTEEGDFSQDVSTQRLKKLSHAELSLEDTGALRILECGPDSTLPGGGFNPYDRTVTASTPASRDVRWTTQGQARKPEPPKQKPAVQSIQSKVAQAALERKPVKDLKRLQEWMEMKKRLESQKDED